jgi:zinc transport system ATP-binding protein
MARIITLEDVGMRWDGKTVLSGIDLSVNEGDFIAMTGPNGGGKTTLLRIILKLLAPTSGSVGYYAGGAEVDRLPIGYLPQKNMIDSRFPITVEEVVASGLLAKGGCSHEEMKSLVERTISLVELESHARAAIGELSGGQLQRALLGRAIISSPEVLVLDEPLSYLDKHFEEHIYRILSTLAPSTTILLVSHEMSVISKMANRHLIVDHALHECTADHHYIQSPCD